MGGSAAGSLRSQQQWSPSWILPEIEIRLKPRSINGSFLCLTCKIGHKKHFA